MHLATICSQPVSANLYSTHLNISLSSIAAFISIQQFTGCAFIGFILFAELILFCFSWWHSAALFIGLMTESSIKLLNNFIEHIDKFSFSVWDGLHISIIQLVLLLIATCFLSLWLFNKNTRAFIIALTAFALFFAMRTADIIHHNLQQKIIVYNIPKQSAVDIITGNTCRFTGDSNILQNAFSKISI
jgi:competence protein ComEC